MTIILCQITSQHYGDKEAIVIDPIQDFATGSLTKSSYARPRKLFTGNIKLIHSSIGTLQSAKVQEITSSVAHIITEK